MNSKRRRQKRRQDKSYSKLSKHHRKPRFLKGSNEDRNISYLSDYVHRAWHVLFSVKTPREIAETINRLFLDPDYEMIARRKLCVVMDVEKS